MASRRKWRTEDFICSKCGKSVESWSRQKQDEHEEMHRQEKIESKKQTKLPF